MITYKQSFMGLIRFIESSIKKRSSFMRNANMNLSVETNIYKNLKFTISADMGLYKEVGYCEGKDGKIYMGPRLNHARIVKDEKDIEGIVKSLIKNSIIGNSYGSQSKTVEDICNDVDITSSDVMYDDSCILKTKAFQKMYNFLEGLMDSKITYFLKDGEFPKCTDRCILPAFVVNFRKNVIEYCSDPYISSYTQMRKSILLVDSLEDINSNMLKYDLVYPVVLTYPYIENRNVVSIDGVKNQKP